MNYKVIMMCEKEEKYNKVKNVLKDTPNIKDGLKEGVLYQRLFIPYTLNGWYIAGCEKKDDDIKLLAMRKWNTPFVLTFKIQIVSLKELINKYDTLTLDSKWTKKHYNSKFSSHSWDKLKNKFLKEEGQGELIEHY